MWEEEEEEEEEVEELFEEDSWLATLCREVYMQVHDDVLYMYFSQGSC